MFHNNILGWLNPDVWCLTSCHWLLPDLLQHGIHLHWLIPIHAVWHPTINGWIPVAVCNPSNRLLGKIYIFFWSAKNATPAAGLQALSRLHLRGSSSCFTLCQCHGPWFHPMWNIDEKNLQPTNQLPLPRNTGATSSTSPDMKSLAGEPPAGSESSPDHVKYPSQMGLRINRFNIKP